MYLRKSVIVKEGHKIAWCKDKLKFISRFFQVKIIAYSRKRFHLILFNLVVIINVGSTSCTCRLATLVLNKLVEINYYCKTLTSL